MYVFPFCLVKTSRPCDAALAGEMELKWIHLTHDCWWVSGRPPKWTKTSWTDRFAELWLQGCFLLMSNAADVEKRSMSLLENLSNLAHESLCCFHSAIHQNDMDQGNPRRAGA